MTRLSLKDALALGRSYARDGKLADAEAIYRQVVATRPDLVPAQVELGEVLRRQGRLEEAAGSYRQVTRTAPALVSAWNNLGSLLGEQNQLAEAAECLERVLELDPNYAQGHNNLGTVLLAQGRVESAADCYRRATKLKPDYAQAHKNLGTAHRDLGELDQAGRCYRRALALEPDYPEAHFYYGMLRLQQGEMAAGWAEYEWRWQWPQYPGHRFRPSGTAWTGEPLEGRTILLHAEQGLGDTIQFVRFAKRVQATGAEVMVQVPDELRQLIRSVDGAGMILGRSDPLPPCPMHASLMSLPHLLGAGCETWAEARGYLRAEDELSRRWRRRLSAPGKLQVGLVWQGRAENTKDRWRSVALAQLAPLLELGEIEFISLQKGPGREQIAAAGLTERIRDFGEGLDGGTDAFVDTAAVIENLDLVVTVDTAAAHLAGALGKVTWLLLPMAPDWRWQLDREDCPWYPSMRLLRQTRRGDWPSVIQRVREELQQLVRRSRERSI